MENLYKWLDKLVSDVVPGEISFVGRLTSQVRVNGVYHQLLQNKHSRIEALFATYLERGAECVAQGVSAGTYLSIEGSGKGTEPCIIWDVYMLMCSLEIEVKHHIKTNAKPDKFNTKDVLTRKLSWKQQKNKDLCSHKWTDSLCNDFTLLSPVLDTHPVT